MSTITRSNTKKNVAERYKSLRNNRLKREIRQELAEKTGLSKQSIACRLSDNGFRDKHRPIVENLLDKAEREEKRILKNGKRV